MSFCVTLRSTVVYLCIVLPLCYLCIGSTDAGFYLPDLHFLSGEFEQLLETGTWAREVPGYEGDGYSLLAANVSPVATEVVPPSVLCRHLLFNSFT